jgi:LPS-assembly protein
MPRSARLSYPPVLAAALLAASLLAGSMASHEALAQGLGGPMPGGGFGTPSTPGMPQVANPSAAPPAARAATPPIRRAAVAPMHRDQPVYYQADAASFDNATGIATLSGHVEFWQDNRLLLADRVTYDRNTGVAAATGNVVLMEPDGQTVFSNYAELSAGMKEGVLSGMRALLAEGGKLAANGMRRTGGEINELSRAVYSTCDLCAKDPSRPPLWQIRARSAVQDVEHKRIEYRDAVVDFAGVPIFWTPYLTHPDPSQKRASGLLVPNIGYSKHLGAFTAIPYYWVIDGASDATITPLVATSNGPGVTVEYRRRFNSGTVTVDTGLANSRGDFGGYLFTKGQFAIDETWRWGFNVNRASDTNYIRDFRIQGWQDVLTSQVYLEGFGQGAYTKLDTRFYQGLSSSISTSKLPTVLPRWQYHLFNDRDPLGGRLSLDADAFNVVRDQGTSTQRARLSLNWDRPAIGPIGDVWKLTLHMDSATYSATRFNEQPSYGSIGSVNATQAMPTAALEVRWPLTRDAGSWGTQLLEPIVQLVAAPRGSSYVGTRVPNEDSLYADFTDANLFALNRFPGVDRLEGGMRANVALHGAWYFGQGSSIDALIGQGYRLQKDTAFPLGSGLRDTATDVVSHLSFVVNPYLDLTTRQRFDRRTGNVKFADILATAGTDMFRVNAGYIYSTTNPYVLYDSATPPAAYYQPRNEVTLGATAKIDHWKLRTWARRDVRTNQMVGLGLGAGYEDECFIFDVNFFRRYTSINGDHGASTVLFQITFKTVGQFGFHAL